MNYAPATSTPRPAWNADPLRVARYRIRHMVKSEMQVIEGATVARYDDTTFGVTRNGYAMLFRKNNRNDTLEAIIERAARYAAGLTNDACFEDELDDFDA